MAFLIAKMNILVLYKEGISIATGSKLGVQPNGILRFTVSSD